MVEAVKGMYVSSVSPLGHNSHAHEALLLEAVSKAFAMRRDRYPGSHVHQRCPSTIDAPVDWVSTVVAPQAAPVLVLVPRDMDATFMQ